MEASVQNLSSKGYGIADDVEIAHVIPGDRILFDRNVPQGPVRCYSATEGNRVLIIEGR